MFLSLLVLPMAAIGENSEFIMVEGKGGRERMIPLSEPAQKAIEQLPWLFASQFHWSGKSSPTRKVFLPVQNI